MITVAPHSGFCFGVRQAIETAEKVIRGSRPDEHVYSFGQIIHNKSVNDDLTEKGLNITDNMDEIPDGSTVIVRSHGEPESFYIAAEKRGFQQEVEHCHGAERQTPVVLKKRI